MINLCPATVSIGFSIRKGAKTRKLVLYSICGGCLPEPAVNIKIGNRRPRLDGYHQVVYFKG